MFMVQWCISDDYDIAGWLVGWLADRKLWSEVMGGVGGQTLVMGWYGG